MRIGLIDILKLDGFDPNLKTKLVRHEDERFDMVELRSSGQLELYQRYQTQPKFHQAEQIVAFYGLPGCRAGFYGVYKVRGYHTRHEKTPSLCDWNSEYATKAEFFYDLERESRFDDLRDRLVIDWGKGALAWVQNLKEKTVLEILESGRRLPPFVDYLDFSLTYAQLMDLFAKEGAHRDWKTALSAVAGVYVILAEKSGRLYVGSAHGVDGVWGRWRNYTETGHGGNEQLRELMVDPDYPQHFRFSLLQILPKSLTREEVLTRETACKRKLGTRDTGHNSN